MANTITIRVDEELHKKIKIKATLEGMTIKDYLLNLAKNDLKEFLIGN